MKLLPIKPLCFDVMRDQRGIDVPEEILDELQRDIMDLARVRFVR